MLPWKENDEAPIEDLLHWHFSYFKLDQDNLHRPISNSKPIKDLLLWHTQNLKLVEDLLHWHSWIEILAGFFVSFGSRMRILAGFFVSFCSWIGIPGKSFIPFGSWIRSPARFLILRAHPKADLYKDGLIFYRDGAALHEFDHVVASRNGSSFLFLIKEKKQKKIKAMIAISFCLVHVIHE